MVVSAGMLLSGRAIIQAVTADASDEMVAIVLPLLFGSYTFLGGLGTTFYVSYFNAVTILVGVIILTAKVFYVDKDYSPNFSRFHEMYESIACISDPEFNAGNSFLNFRSEGAILFGIILLLGSTTMTYTDQASWQSRIAAKPTQGVLGFFLGALIWFAIPSTFATASGISYLVTASTNGSHFLSATEINGGN